jgi:hypothetical protein
VTSVAALYELQEIDLALSACRTEYTDAQERLQQREALDEAERIAAERQEELRAAEKQFKEREFEADELRRKIEPVEKKLYQGGGNPKELEDLQRDLESLRRRQSELEDRALEAMETLETAQRAHDEAQAALREAQEARAAEERALRDRQAALDREARELEERRAAHAASIDARLLALYDRLAGMRGGRAVAKVAGGACQGCRISLPMNLIQRARSGGEPVQCSSCERILYVS